MPRLSRAPLVALAAILWPGSAGAWTLDDPLAGSSAGDVRGGSLGADGWTTTGTDDSIVYVVPRLVTGFVELTISGITIDALPAVDHEIFSMYDGQGLSEPVSYSPYFRNNAFKMLVRIYGQNEPSRTGMQKLLYSLCPLGPPGYSDGACPCPSYFNEEPFGGDTTWSGAAEVLRVEWDQTSASYYRNGTFVQSVDWGSTGILWGPEELHVMLGSPRNQLAPSVAMPIGITYSSVHIEGEEGAATPPCDGGTGGGGAGGTGAGGGSPDCSPELSAVSLSPTSGVGQSAVFDATYRYTQGADLLRIAQLFVGPSVDVDQPHLNVGMEANVISLDGQNCTPGDPVVLEGTYGLVDCMATGYSLSGNDALVTWAVGFDPAQMAGTHNVYLDAKAQGDPQPRLCWTEMGTWEVPSGGGGGSGTGAAGAGGDGGVGASGGAGAAAGAPAAAEDSGCGCRLGGARHRGLAPVSAVGLAALGYLARGARRRRLVMRPARA